MSTVCLGILLAVAGCSDDDTAQECGNEQVEGTEQCDGDQLGGNTCLTVPGDFTGGTLGCAANCVFDTSGCTSTQTNCGDEIVDADEDCDGSALGNNTCSDVGNYVGGTLACADDCTWDVSQCEVPLSCGNAAIDAGENCDGTALGNQTCADVGNYNSGTLACAGDCTWDVSQCIYELSPSEQIAAVRAVPDATGYTLEVQNVLVTYLKPALGNDPAGFVIQAHAAGPALFVRVDPTTLSPAAAPGDEVSFTVLQMDTAQGRREVQTITGWQVHTSDNALAPLTQTVSTTTDLVSALDDYEVELITLDGTVVGEFVSGGTAHSKAPLETVGVVGNSDLQLRLPETLTTSLGLTSGCTVTVTQTPLWRFLDEAQVMAYDASEITVNSCPSPQVVSATATDATTVVVVMDHPMDPSSITDAAAQITFTGGLTASAATVNQTEITVTTSVQTPATTYVVTVAGTVTDTLGRGVDPAADDATFPGFDPNATEQLCADGIDDDNDGYIDCLDADCSSDAACAWPSGLYLWELDADQPGGDATEYAEIWNNTGAAMDFDAAPNRYYLLLVNGNGEVVYGGGRLTGVLADGDVYVVGVATVPNVDLTITPANDAIQNGTDGLLLVHCPDCTSRTADFPNGHAVSYSATSPNYTSAAAHDATWIDALAYETSNSDDPALWTVLNVTGQYDEESGPNGVADNLQRTSPSGWSIAPPTPGTTGFE